MSKEHSVPYFPSFRFLRICSVAAIALSGSLSVTTVFAQDADMVLVDAHILTVDDDFSVAESLAIRDGRIVAVGDDDDTAPLIGGQTFVLDLDGKTVIPGLIDNHLHFIRGVWNFQSEARLDGVRSRKEALRLIAERVEAVGPGSWVTVMGGWVPAQFQDDARPFTLAELDEVAPDNPVFLMRNYSNGFANSAAFAAAGIAHNGSAVLRGRDGLRTFINQVSWRNKSSSKEAILAYMKELNRVGLTTVYGVGRPSEGKLAPLEKLASEQALPLRVFHTLRYSARDPESVKAAIALLSDPSVRPFTRDEQFGLLGLGEHLYVPVSDNPRHDHDWPEESWGPFSEIVTTAARFSWPIHEHMMSRDTAVQFLSLVDEISGEFSNIPSLRWTIAHANGMQDEDIKRAADLGIAMALHSQARMSTRVEDAPRIGSIARSGALWGLGSDAGIVASYLPFETLEWVIAGTNIADGEAWAADQRVSRAEALTAHTRYNAELLFMEDELGSLEVGKLADLLVLDRDFMTVEESQISDILPIITITGGNIVHMAD